MVFLRFVPKGISSYFRAYKVDVWVIFMLIGGLFGGCVGISGLSRVFGYGCVACFRSLLGFRRVFLLREQIGKIPRGGVWQWGSGFGFKGVKDLSAMRTRRCVFIFEIIRGCIEGI